MTKQRELTILGAGTAGLAVGYYAKKQNVPFTIYEASDRVGGNSITFRYKGFLIDSGAHRFHDKEPNITAEIQRLLGEDFQKINVPSQIYFHNKFIDFPLSPLNLLQNMGILNFLRAGYEVLLARLQPQKPDPSFESYALNTYGKTVARLFLLNYSEKLWGRSCNTLSPDIAGKRLKGLDIKSLIVETLSGSQAKTEHLDGSFYYPKMGIGSIAESLAKCCGGHRIFTDSKITKIYHENKKIRQIEINGAKKIDASEVVSTLPVSLLLDMLRPDAPATIMSLTQTLCFRHVILVALFLNKPLITKNASIYFPDTKIPFTRIFEPRNRSQCMSPDGQTSLVAEIPCQEEDSIWQYEEKVLSKIVRQHVRRIGIVDENDIIDSKVYRMKFAYPVLELGIEEKIKQLQQYLNGFENLKVTGRNGKFVYSHIHDMLSFGKNIIAEYSYKHTTQQNHA
jgi:protoporphyrinogen oxidase